MTNRYPLTENIIRNMTEKHSVKNWKVTNSGVRLTGHKADMVSNTRAISASILSKRKNELDFIFHVSSENF